MSQRAAAEGADFALVVAPPYVRPTQDGLVRHYREVADRAGLPIMLYNVPARTGCDLLPETVARLVDHERIIGIKEARADADRMKALLAIQGSGFKVFSGDDPTCARAISQGADGVISVSANVAPADMQNLCMSATAGSVETAQLDSRLQTLHAAMGLESNPIPVKWALAKLGISSSRLRLPLLPLVKPYHGQIERALASLTMLGQPK